MIALFCLVFFHMTILGLAIFLAVVIWFVAKEFLKFVWRLISR
jgi:hypothetical protein